MHNFETFTVLQFNNRVVNINLENLTHEDSLVAPVSGGNCINWILGHMLVTRDDINEILGIEKICDEILLERYKRGTKPITKENAVDISELLELFNKSQAAIEEKVSSTDFKNRQDTLKDLVILAFHEAYHAGQTGLLRRVAGKTGAIK